MIPEIDFLPASYHKLQKRHKKRAWNRFIVIAFIGLAGLGAFAQWRIESKLETERDKVLAQANRLTASPRKAEDLKKQIAELDLQADLVTQLSVRARLSQLLNSLSGARPEYVRLLEVQTKFEKLEVIKSPSSKRRKKKQEAKKDVNPFEADLLRIRETAGQQALYTTLRGVAPDDLAVSQFLSKLQETKHFQSIVLLYSDEYQFGEFKLRNFGVRLRLRQLGNTPNDAVSVAGQVAPRAF